METMEAIKARKSTRVFKPDQISERDLEVILDAAVEAPVAFGEYMNIHLTVIQNSTLLEDLKDIGMDCYRDPIRDMYYGAPTVIVISTKHGSVPELDMANAGTIAQNILLCATDLGLSSCYVWGTALACRVEPDFVDDLNLPDGFEPIGSVAIGYAAPEDEKMNSLAQGSITINRV